jgi:hypothetical protein
MSNEDFGTLFRFAANGVAAQRAVNEITNGEQLRDQGIKQVSEHNENWMDEAIRAVKLWIRLGFLNEDFTGEDIRIQCLKLMGHPRHPNAWGALINTLIKRKIIVPTGEYRAMKDSSSHARKTPVYKAT